jgi:hypothetical protein
MGTGRPARAAAATLTLTPNALLSGVSNTLVVSTTFTVSPATLQLLPGMITQGSQFRVIGAGYAPHGMLTLKLDGSTLDTVVATAAGALGPKTITLPAGIANGQHTMSVHTSTGETLARAILVVNLQAATLAITPTTGIPGAQLTATGAGFSAAETVLIAINGATLAAATADAQGRISATFVLPAHLPAGNFTVQAAGQSSQRAAAAALPVASPARISLHTTALRAGEALTVTGAAFAPYEQVRLSIPDHASSVVVADAQGNFTSTITIPVTAPSAAVQVSAVGQQSQRAASAALTITAVPAGLSLSAGTVFTLGSFTVDGSGFHPGEQVHIGVSGQRLSTATANAQGAFASMAVTLPASIAPGTVQVIAAGQSSQRSAAMHLTVQARVGSVSISPTSFARGTQVRIAGNGFAPREEVTLAVNGGAPFATVLAGSDGGFVFSHTLPAHLAPGSVRITAGGVSSQTVAAVNAQISAPVPANLGSSTWYFAGGRTDSGYREQIAVLNPHDSTIHGTIVLSHGTGNSSAHPFELRPHARGTYDLNQLVGSAGRVAGVVHTDRQVVVARTTLRGNAEVMPAGAVTAPSRTWYMAEGYTGLTFQEELDLFNPSDQPANVRVTWPLFNGKPAVTHQVTLAPHSQQTIPVNAHVDRASHATLVNADVPVVASRSMQFGAQQQGAFTSVGATHTGTTLYFAEGSTNNGFEQYLTIFNPGNSPARVAAHVFDRQGNSLGSRMLTVEAMRRATIKVNEVTSNTAIATVVQSSSPIVAERAMYFGAPNGGGTGGTVVFGQPTPALGWGFASGDTRPGNSQFELLFNPHRSESMIEATYYTDDGQVVRRMFSLPGNARLNIDVARQLPELPRGHHGVILRSTNGVPFIAEQAIYGQGMASGGATIGTPMS